jgi:hypothetical protein
VKTLVKAVVGLGVLAVVVIGMMEATQNRPDEVREGTTTEVTFEVSTRDVERGEAYAAAALWAVCAGTVSGEITAPVPVDADGDGAWLVTIEPAIGEHGENRLVGCLEDVTIDRVLGHVVSLETSAAASAS